MTTVNIRWKKWKDKANRLIDDKPRLKQLAEQAYDKGKGSKSSILNEVRDDLFTLIRLVKAWASGEYKVIPLKSLSLAVLGMIYFLSPFDAMPDAIPFFGFLDDIRVLQWVFASIKEDLRLFKTWEKNREDCF